MSPNPNSCFHHKDCEVKCCKPIWCQKAHMLPSPSQNCFPDPSWMVLSIPWLYLLTWHHWGEKSFRWQVSTLDSDKLPACQGRVPVLPIPRDTLQKQHSSDSTACAGMSLMSPNATILSSEQEQAQLRSLNAPHQLQDKVQFLVRLRTLWSLAPAGPSSCTFHCSSLAKSMPEETFDYAPLAHFLTFISYPSLGTQISPCVFKIFPQDFSLHWYPLFSDIPRHF